MNHRILVAPIFLLLAAQYGCEYDCGDDECMFTRTQWDELQTLSPIPEPPPDPTNKYWDHPGAVALGQKLFFEKRYSGPIRLTVTAVNGGLGLEGEKGKVNCAACHLPNAAFIDKRTVPNNVSLGAGYSARNSPSLINTVYYDWHAWTGRQDTLWNQSSTAPESPDLSGDRCDFARMLFSYYREEYDAIFDEDLPVELADTSTTTALRFPLKCKPKANAMAPDGPWEMMAPPDRKVVLRIMANYAKAIAAYETRLISRDAPFDRYVAGDREAISGAAKRGLKLFIGKAACNECHSGPLMTDQKFHNIGVPQQGVNVPHEDLGRFRDLSILMNHPLNSLSEFSDGPNRVDISGLMPKEEDKGLFRTPMLRGIAETAPYYHNGGASTLEAVVRFYNEGGGNSGFSGVKDVRMMPLGLSAGEVSDLVAFLETLTGQPVEAEMLDNPLD